MDVVIDIPRVGRGTYTVSGSTFRELGRQMDARGEWAQFTGRLMLPTHGNPVTRVTVTCRPVITMPEWAERSAASRAMQAEWDRMIVALERHEMRHDAILREAAEAFRVLITQMRPPPDSRALRRLRRDMVRDHTAQQRAFDRATAHGANTGVTLVDR